MKRSKQTVHLSGRILAFLIPVSLAASVGTVGAIAQNDGAVTAAPRPLVRTAAQPQSQSDAAQKPDDEDPVPNLPGMQVFQGSGTFVNPPGSGQRMNQTGDVTLDFSDADIREVVRTIFGDILQRSYTIDPKVTGRITLKTGKPISKEAALAALETALKVSGAAISRTGDVYNIVPVADAQHTAQSLYGGDDRQTPGYGVEVVPLQYVSAEEMQRVLTPLVPEGGILQIDTKRNLIFLAGAEPERAAIRDTIARFDVNYLKGMSFALIQPTHADAETLAGELDKIFGEANSPISGLVRIVPIPRINSLLIITSRPKYLHEVQRWVGRLDIAPVTPDRKLYFYKLQNARARDVAEILGRLFGGTSGGSTQETGATTTPFSTSSLTSSSTRSTLSSTSSTATTTPTQPSTNFSQGNGGGGNAQNPNSPQIVTDEANNALIIRADGANYAAIEDVIQKMDVTPNQVMVEATIVEVSLNDTLKYGVEWYFQKNNSTFTMSPDGAVATTFPGLGITYTVSNINAALSTLGALTDVTVLSSPKILTLDNKAAMIEVGDQIPIVTQTSVSTTSSDSPVVSSVEQRDTGVILTVTPRIGNSGIVYLDVTQEVSTSTQTTTSNIDSPTIQQRRLHAAVAINDGATIALGGLIQRSDTMGNSGVPYLKDIPLLGGLFSTRSSVRGRTELLIFLTPRVIRNLPAALDATERLKKEMSNLQEAMDRLENQRVPRRPW